LTAHPPDKAYIPSAAWATLTGHTIPIITSNAAALGADGTDYSAVADIGRYNCQIEANIRAGTTSGAENWIKILFRVLDVDNMWGVQVGETSSASFNLNIIKWVGASATTMVTRSCTFSDATDYKIVVRCTGNLIYVSLNDGGADLQYHTGIANTDNAKVSNWWAPGTKVGFWNYISATSTYYPLIYDFKVLG